MKNEEQTKVEGDIETLLKEIQELRNPWVSVSERLPNENDEILVYSLQLEEEHGRPLAPMAVFYADNKFNVYGNSHSQHWLETVDITHWMPLPNPPKV